MIGLRERVLSDLLALVTVIDLEADRELTAMENFDGPAIYKALLDLLKRYQIMQWLVTNIRKATSSRRGRSPQSKAPKDKAGDGRAEVTTILESIFALHLKPQSTGAQSQSEALTHDIQDLLQWVVGGNNEVNFDDVPVYIQCDLLKHNDLELATDFFGFQPSTAWSTYIKGRFFLMKDKPSEAAVYFKKAAFKLCKPSQPPQAILNHRLTSPTQPAPQNPTTSAPPTSSSHPPTHSTSATASQPTTPISPTSSTPSTQHKPRNLPISPFKSTPRTPKQRPLS